MRSLTLALALAGCAHRAPARSPRVTALPACPSEPAEDFSRLVGVKVAHVDVRGAEPAVVGTLVETRPGVPLDPDTLRGDVRRLWKLGIASQIAVTAEPSPDGYAIELVMAPPPRVRAVEIVGVPRDQLAPFTILEGALHDPQRLVRLTEAATRWWRARGYLHAEIAARARVECGEAIVHVTASLGRRYTLARLDITGSALPAPASLFEHELGATNRVGAAFREDVFADDLDTLAERHRRAGWLDVTIEDATSHVDEASGTITASARVVPGVRYRFGALTVEGGTAAQRKAVEEVIAPLRGRWYDADALDDASRRFGDRLADLGTSAYWETSHAHDAYDVKIVIREPGR